MNIIKQGGFTLVEIAIVLVIIGLLLGGMLKGQELINSARVRNLADQNAGVQAAYYGFVGRYRQIPGDWKKNDAAKAIGQDMRLGGNGNGQIDNTLEEAAAVWEHLARANFLGAGFSPWSDGTKPPSNENDYQTAAPLNAFNGVLILTRNSAYTGVSGKRLNLHVGRNIPVVIARELDTKVDDGLPNTGILRLTKPDGVETAFDTFNYKENFTSCSTLPNASQPNNSPGTANDEDNIYDIYDDAGDCGQVFIY